MAAVRCASSASKTAHGSSTSRKICGLTSHGTSLIERLNRDDPPIDLKAVRAIASDGYGWTEFIDHAGTDRAGCQRFFRRAGAWLALFHCFVANDMHQENMIAAGEHPVPIDLETILQSNIDESQTADPEAQAFDLATEKLANSVMMVGLLPAYGRSPDNNVFAIGGMTADWNAKIKIKWENINTDEMRPTRSKEVTNTNPNLPFVDGRYVKLADHTDDLVSGFRDYTAISAATHQVFRTGKALQGFCRPSGPQGHSCHAVLLHAAAAVEKHSVDGRRNSMVCAG